MTRAWAFLILAAGLGCTRIGPVHDGPPPGPPVGEFSHEAFDRVLERFVDAEGRVAYVRLQNDRVDLDRYCRSLARYSPDSHPELFPTEASRLAYWINAYNAAAIKAVLQHYPIDSVLDVKRPRLLFFLPGKSGFFVFQRVSLGGREMSLYHLESKIIRKRFDDPRIHFALNCASASCPTLPQHAFSPEHLDAELDRETRKFLSQPRNFRIDHERRAVILSEILDWYRDDFLDWYRRNVADRQATLLDFTKLYMDVDATGEQRIAEDYAIRFTPYDWSLNDRGKAAAQ